MICLVAATGVLAAATPAIAAKRGPCVAGQKSGPKCLIWDAKVKWAADGDTVKPLVFERGRWTKRTVRMTAIQAPELKDYSRRSRKGECMAVEATETLDKLVHHGTFRLVSLGRTVGGGDRGRIRRSLQVKRGGKWVDPAMTLLEKGLVLWSSDGDEWAWNGVYSRLAAQAAARGVGLWNPEACGHSGPSRTSPLSMKLRWDGQGRDTANSEWVRIKNGDPFNAVSLRGWRLRDPGLLTSKMKSGYRFPASASIPAGGSITVRIGKGTNGDGIYYWGLSKPLFQNATNDKKQIGDGVYLFDPDDEMRAHVLYPCRVTCTEPLAGKVSVETRYMGATHEWVTVRNTSSEPISLNEYEIENVPWFYEFGPTDILAPGQSVVVFRDQPHDVPITLASAGLVRAVPGRMPFKDALFFRSWGHSEALFGDRDDVVTLRNPLGGPVVCDAWGGLRCPDA